MPDFTCEVGPRWQPKWTLSLPPHQNASDVHLYPEQILLRGSCEPIDSFCTTNKTKGPHTGGQETTRALPELRELAKGPDEHHWVLSITFPEVASGQELHPGFQQTFRVLHCVPQPPLLGLDPAESRGCPSRHTRGPGP